MSKNKLFRYASLKDLENVVEAKSYNPNVVSSVKGRWVADIFKNGNPIVLELACGKGEYTTTLAGIYPQKNFIGVDVKGDRLWKGAVEAAEKKVGNVRFLRIYIDHIENYFEAKEVSEIWITFPDPYLNKKKINKRLTSPVFLNRYKNILLPGGLIHLKTDDITLFSYTLQVIKDQSLKIVDINEDVHGSLHSNSLLNIKTYYENMHLEEGKKIKYISFRIDETS